jgi:hypothetical protein
MEQLGLPNDTSRFLDVERPTLSIALVESCIVIAEA